MVIGILANSEVMSMALVVGVFLANFPEAIATASMMRKGGMSWYVTILYHKNDYALTTASIDSMTHSRFLTIIQGQKYDAVDLSMHHDRGHRHACGHRVSPKVCTLG